MTPELPVGTVTFLFTDIEGSTKLLHELGPARYADVLAEHLRVLRSAVAANGGREVDTQGDSLFAAFPRAKSAVTAAVEAQRALGASTIAGVDVRVRMGLHTGEPVVGDERYVGMGVHKAARIGAAGHGGQVLLSRTTGELVEDELPDGATLRDLGRRRLKDVQRAEPVYQLVIPGLRSDFPPLRTLDLERRRKRRRVALLAVVLALAGAAVAASVFVAGSEGAGDVVPNSVALVDVGSNAVVGTVPVGVEPRSVAVSEGVVLVANTADATVSRIDPSSRSVVRTIPVADFPSDIALSGGTAWVALGGPSQLVRVSLERNEPDAPIPALAPSEGFTVTPCSRPWASLALGGEANWFVCNNDNSSYPLTDASRIDSATGDAVRLVELLSSSSPLGVSFSDVALGGGSVWIANLAGNTVIEIDASTSLRVREVAVGTRPEAVALGFGSVWTANAGEDSVTRVTVESPHRPAVVHSIPVGSSPSDVAVGDDAVWVVNRGDGTLSRIDPTRNEVVERVTLGHQPMRAAVSSGLVWVTVQAVGSEGTGS